MPLILDFEKINNWRQAQRTRIARHQSVEEVAELPPGRPIGYRLARLAMATMVFVMLIGGFIYFFAPLILSIGDRALRIFAILAVIAFTGAIWKVAWSLLQDSLGRASRGESARRMGRSLGKQGKVLHAACCYAESLTYPWRKRVIPTLWDADSFYKKHRSEQRGHPVFVALADLLFVELFLEVSLNSQSDFSGIAPESRRRLPDLVTDSDELVQFGRILRGMDQDPKPDPYLVKLAGEIRTQGPRLAAQMIGTRDAG